MKNVLGWLALGAGLALVAACDLEQGLRNQAVITYPKGAVLSVHDSSALGTQEATRQAIRFAALESVPYFGAFAASDAGLTGVVVGYHSLDDAKAEAVRSCQEHANKNKPDAATCSLRMTAAPNGYQRRQGITLSEWAGAEWRRYQGEKGPKAFAFGYPNQHASNFGGASAELVRERALRNCDSGRSKNTTVSRCSLLDLTP